MEIFPRLELVSWMDWLDKWFTWLVKTYTKSIQMSDKLLIYKIYHGKLKTAKYVQIDPKLQEFSWPQFGGQFF